jgi:hypothetical protein
MLDVATVTFALPVWAVAVILALFAVAAVTAFFQTGANDVLLAFVRAGVVFVAAALVVWIFLDRTAARDREAERRALDARISELAVRAVAPGSPLACLDAIAGDAVETACEKALFSSPEVTASAVSYVSARLNLLAQGLDIAGRGNPEYGAALSALRQSLESDRFGIVAQVLSLRDSCTPAQCETFGLLRDTTRVRANLRDRTFDSYVERNAANWSRAAPVADASAGSVTSTGSLGPAVPTRPAGMATRDYPSASSIPPVSIMTAEPDGARTAPAPPQTAPASTPPPRKPPPRAAAAPAARASQNAPVPLTPTSPPTAEAGPATQ